MKLLRDLEPKVRLYVSIVILLGILTLGYSITWYIPRYAVYFYEVLFFFLLNLVLSSIKFRMFDKVIITFNNPACIASMFILPWQIAPLPILLSYFIADYVDTRKNYGLFLPLFNASNHSISAFIGSYLFHSLAGSGFSFSDLPTLIYAGLAALVYSFVNGLIVSTAVALQEEYNPLDLVREITEIKTFLPTASTIIISIILVFSFFQFNQYVLLLGVFMLFLIYSIYKREERLRHNRKAAIRSLVEAIGARDEYTKRHCLRVADLAHRIAKDLKLPYRQIEMIEFAAMLHDLGKISFPDKAFVQKRLDFDTWEVIKEHPGVGKSILSEMNELDEIIKYVELHHERFDGSGYPQKLKFDEIPIAARILAVCDSFDAMISNRAYRRAFPPETAYKEIMAYRGTAFDPEVVDSFSRVINDYLCDLFEDENYRLAVNI